MTTPLPGTDAGLFGRFMAKVTITESCWLWTAASQGGGYGVINVSGSMVLAHRCSWTVFRGPIPDDLCVLHDCPGGDNPLCVNPAHLWLGTVADNNSDMAAKGRSTGGDRHWSHTHPELVPRGDRHYTRLRPEARRRGEQNPAAVLNEVAVRVIRFLASRGISQRKLGAAYGVRQTAISLIVRRERWRHVA